MYKVLHFKEREGATFKKKIHPPTQDAEEKPLKLLTAPTFSDHEDGGNNLSQVHTCTRAIFNSPPSPMT